MSMLQTTTEHSSSGNVHCPRCDAVLPPQATFCGSCGERVGKEKKGPSPAQDGADVASRYRVTSLVRRRPYVNLFFAVDNQQQRMVVIRNIDISSLDEEAQAKASKLTQSEYDLLRQQGIAHVMPVIDLQESQSHLLTIAGQPLLDYAGAGGQKDTSTRLRTLQDFVHSGAGLPSQQLALSWIGCLCQSVESLHQHQIVIGDLDPLAILLNGDDYHSQPLLTASWLPPQLRGLLPHIVSGQGESSSASVLATSFSAPEVLLGKVEPASDVYSLGAILYLLLTGTPPDELIRRTQQRLRSPYKLNPHMSSGLAEIVMHALSLEPSERFQSVKELAEALSKRYVVQAPKAFAIPPRPVQNGHHALQRDQIADMETVNIMQLLSFKNGPSDRRLWETATGPTEESRSMGETLRPQPATEKEPAAQDQPGLPSNHEFDDPKLLRTSANQSKKELALISPTAAAGRDHQTLVQQFTQHISGILPVIPHLPKQITGILSPLPHTSQPKAEQPQAQTQASPAPQAEHRIWKVGTLFSKQDAAQISTPPGETKPATPDASLLKQIQRIVIGERQQTTTVATIENPLRVQPDQGFCIRIRLMGRDEPDTGMLPGEQASDPARPPSRLYGTKEAVQSAGLSGRVHDELVYVEVRSAIHQHYAYIVQQAAVKIPALGYVAEIIIPMQPFSRKSNGRRERLHLFFFDEMHRPLYDKPFVLEVLVSHLVQPGREGHHVLPIPQ